MPVGLDRLQKKIWNRLKGKINPRTKKPYTESDAWAIATAAYKKQKKLNSEIKIILNEIKELSRGLKSKWKK